MVSDTFSENVLIIYYFVDHFMKGINTKTDKQHKFTVAHVMSIAFAAAKNLKVTIILLYIS